MTKDPTKELIHALDLLRETQRTVTGHHVEKQIVAINDDEALIAALRNELSDSIRILKSWQNGLETSLFTTWSNNYPANTILNQQNSLNLYIYKKLTDALEQIEFKTINVSLVYERTHAFIKISLDKHYWAKEHITENNYRPSATSMLGIAAIERLMVEPNTPQAVPTLGHILDHFAEWFEDKIPVQHLSVILSDIQSELIKQAHQSKLLQKRIKNNDVPLFDSWVMRSKKAIDDIIYPVNKELSLDVTTHNRDLNNPDRLVQFTKDKYIEQLVWLCDKPSRRELKKRRKRHEETGQEIDEHKRLSQLSFYQDYLQELFRYMQNEQDTIFDVKLISYRERIKQYVLTIYQEELTQCEKELAILSQFLKNHGLNIHEKGDDR